MMNCQDVMFELFEIDLAAVVGIFLFKWFSNVVKLGRFIVVKIS
jgi:hypothetical protein